MHLPFSPSPTESVPFVGRVTRRAFIFAAALLIAPSRARSASVSHEIAPSESKKADFVFDITSKPQSDGTVAFRVVITRDNKPFPTNFTTSLSVVSIADHSEAIAVQRQLPSQSKNHSVICEFSVTKTSLDDPNFCFVFTNYPRPGMPSADFCYARLKKFLDAPARSLR